MRYLSPEWFAAAQAALQDDPQLRELTSELDLTVEQTVTGDPVGDGGDRGDWGGTGDAGTIQWHLVFDHGSVRLLTGPAARADLRFRAPYPVAAAIAAGTVSAAHAFIRGDLTVGGDLRLLTAHQRVFAAVGDVMKQTGGGVHAGDA